jgi:hypothetical protein
MNKKRIEKIWEELRSDEYGIKQTNTKVTLIELCEALMDEEEEEEESVPVI